MVEKKIEQKMKRSKPKYKTVRLHQMCKYLKLMSFKTLETENIENAPYMQHRAVFIVQNVFEFIVGFSEIPSFFS